MRKEIALKIIASLKKSKEEMKAKMEETRNVYDNMGLALDITDYHNLYLRIDWAILDLEQEIERQDRNRQTIELLINNIE